VIKIRNPFSRKGNEPKGINRIQTDDTGKTARNKYSPFQLFALTYFYATGLEQNKLMEADPNMRIRMGVADFVHVTPKEFLPGSADQVRKELRELQIDLLLSDVAETWFLTRSEGQLYVKKYLDQLVPKIHDRREYESIIDSMTTSSEVRSNLRQLFDKFKDQSQDEIVKSTIAAARQYGPVVFIAFIKILFPN
jgi:hypothetical protein